MFDSTALDFWTMMESLLLTLLFSGMIGYERQSKHKVAGLTTHMLVALGAATLAIIQEGLYQDSITLINEMAVTNPDLATRIVPERQRIIAQIVAGVGFLGTGAIIKTNGSIVGLTTASSLWITAIIGIAFGMQYFVLGIAVSLFALSALTLVKRVFKNLYVEQSNID
jgi:putative Mg2+ transporter-C (MgtC) family protein